MPARRNRFVVVISGMLLLSLVLTSCGAGYGSVRPAGLAPDLSIPEQAAELADRLVSARSDKARYQALLDVMQTLAIGVYTPEGEAIVRGAERGWGDFYLYAFEVQALAENFGRGESYTLSQSADTLTRAGIQPGGDPLDPDDLRLSLQLAVVDSRNNPDDPFSLLPLLIDELALQRPEGTQDLSADLTAEQVQLDALQSFLIAADVLIPYVLASDPLQPGVSGGGGGLNAPVPLQEGGCPPLNEGFIHNAHIGKLLNELTHLVLHVKHIPFLSTATSYAAAAFTGIEALHGIALAWGIQVKALEPKVGPTHYGHGSPGKPLKFRIRVVNLADFGEVLVKCGWMATVTFPPKGPVEGVDVVWMVDDLKNHGSLDCSHGAVFSCYSKTDGSGVATLTFTPKDEMKPYGLGLEQERIGVVNGVAQYLSGLGNGGLISIAEIGTPKADSIQWSVRFHQATPYRVQGGADELKVDEIVCDFSKPFTLHGIGGAAVVLVFTPTEAGDGTYTYDGQGGGAHLSGSGTYSLKLGENDGAIIAQGSGSADTPLGTFTNSGTEYYSLTRVEGAQCP